VIKSFMSDPTVPANVRLKAAQDLADRAGLVAAQVYKIIPTEQPRTVKGPHPVDLRTRQPGVMCTIGNRPLPDQDTATTLLPRLAPIARHVTPRDQVRMRSIRARRTAPRGRGSHRR
jgi:hypothetical protein